MVQYLAGQDNPYKYDEILPTCLRGSESVWHLLRNSFIGLWILPPAGIFPQLGFSQKVVRLRETKYYRLR
jgi:hypothetical protein